MKRKYLDDINVSKELRPELWKYSSTKEQKLKEQREIYGFDERETYSLDTTFYLWLYERLMMFKEVNCIDMEYHTFKYKGEVLTQRECIDKMIEGCKLFLSNASLNYTEEEQEKIDDVANIWALVLKYMWW